MQDGLVSIITPFKNTAKFLPECINSIINQTYTNWELLIVDDHSTDESFKIMQVFAKHEPRLKLYKNEDYGIINALKLGYKHCSGSFITRMDSDDIMTETKIESLVSDLNLYGKGYVATGLVTYFSEEGIGDGYFKYQNWLNDLTKNGSNYSEIYKECVISSPCWMVHREDLNKVDAFNPNRYPEDYDLTFRFYKHGLKCIPTQKMLHYWRDYSSRTSRTHEHYAQNYFLELKLHYFLDLEYDCNRPLVIWGAGFKGKTIAKLLIKNNITFFWICDNPKKIGRKIYNQEMLPFEYLTNLKNPQSIITVANEQAQIEIRNYFANLRMQPMFDYFFFC